MLYCPSNTSTLKPSTPTHNYWQSIPGTSTKEEEVSVTPDFETYLSEDDFDEGELEERGQQEAEAQSGLLKSRAQTMLRPGCSYISKISDGEVQIDLNYLEADEQMIATSNIIREVIKIFSNIPGEVRVQSHSNGIFSYHLTNKYFSPSTGSPCSGTSGDKPRSDGDPDKEIEIERIIGLFREGIVINPKMSGLPKKKISLDTKGFSEQYIRSLLHSTPGSKVEDILKHIWTERGEWRSMKNFYHV